MSDCLLLESPRDPDYNLPVYYERIINTIIEESMGHRHSIKKFETVIAENDLIIKYNKACLKESIAIKEKNQLRPYHSQIMLKRKRDSEKRVSQRPTSEYVNGFAALSNENK